MPERGKIVYVEHESKLLQGNPLGDPHVRRFPVYLPPGYDSSGGRYPVIFGLVGFTGKGQSYLNWRFGFQTFDEILDELIIDLNRMLNMTFVVVTHELPSIFRIADRVIVLDASVKTMVGLDTPQKLRDDSPNEWVRDFFSRKPTAPASDDDNAAVATAGQLAARHRDEEPVVPLDDLEVAHDERVVERHRAEGAQPVLAHRARGKQLDPNLRDLHPVPPSGR